LQQLVGQARVRIDVRPDPNRMRPNDMPLILGNPRRIQEEVGWMPTIAIEQTMSDLLDYWRVRTRTEG
jgi:GDP-4-dehydro-6-deoxy-D-mannose reductase